MRDKLKMWVGLLALAAAALACNLPAARPQAAVPPPTPTGSPPLVERPQHATPTAAVPAPTPTASPTPVILMPPAPAPHLSALLDDVSAERLMQHVEALAAIHSRHFNSATADRAAQYIAGAMQAAGAAEVEYVPFAAVVEDLRVPQVNVVGTLPGTDPDAGVVIVGAHYDSRNGDWLDGEIRAPGANDNASGVAALLEITRGLAAGERPMTVKLVAFAAEEVGAQGSRYYAQLTQTLETDVRAVLVLDMIGNATGPECEGSIRVFSAPPEASPSRVLARTVDVAGRLYLPEFVASVQPTIDRPGRYSDHVPFSDAGYPAVRFIEAVEDVTRQHSADDLPEHISPSYLRDATRLALASVASIAGAPPPPASLDVDDTRLVWEPVKGAAGYVVALRHWDSLTYEQLAVTDSAEFDLSVLEPGLFNAASVASISQDGLVGLFGPELIAGE